MANVYTHSENDGDFTTTTEYTCTKKGMQYTIIGEDIKSDFNFLLPGDEISRKLDDMLGELEIAANNVSGFEFSNGSTVRDLQHVYDEISKDVRVIKENLSTLHSALITDIDNVNAELEVNFGYWVGYKVNAGKTTKTPNSSSVDS